MLASRSPRRLRLLRGLGFDPVVRVPDVDERRSERESYAEYTRRLSHNKAEQVGVRLDVSADVGLSPWVVAADTVVVLDGDLLEKPVDAAEACRMLRRLSGNQHRVITSYTVVDSRDLETGQTRTVEAEVVFKALTDGEIECYVATAEPLDKAGAYGIQEVGSFLVRAVNGSYFTVVGLPVCELIETLVELGAVSSFPFADRRQSA